MWSPHQWVPQFLIYLQQCHLALLLKNWKLLVRCSQNTVFKHHKLRIVTQTPLVKHSYQTLFFFEKQMQKHQGVGENNKFEMEWGTLRHQAIKCSAEATAANIKQRSLPPTKSPIHDHSKTNDEEREDENRFLSFNMFFYKEIHPKERHCINTIRLK